MSRAKQAKIYQGQVESLTLEAQGVTRVDGKVYFVDGALPGETVSFEVKRNRRKHGHARLLEIIEPEPGNGRIEADCEYFGVCGGCSFRHYDLQRQLEVKHQALMDAFERIGKVQPETVFEPISGDWLHYRRKARLGVRYVEKKGGALVGFREKNNSFITPLKQCLTLTKSLSALLPALENLLNQLSVKQHIPQIEVADGDNQISLVFRELLETSDDDKQLLIEFAKTHGVQVFLQPGGLKTIYPLYPKNPQVLFYRLQDYDVNLNFAPTDFIQVNAQANQMLIRQALEFLELDPDDKVLDLYCGLGNFSLPLARKCRQVLGLEGDARLIEKARNNAQLNQLDNVEFIERDLSVEEADFSWLNGQYNKILIDPARSGAQTVCQKLIGHAPEVLVYVSCNPSTLARDADILVHQVGMELVRAGVVNMFPHTAHIESIAVFKRKT